MKQELVTQLHQDFESSARKENEIEFWCARELQKLLGYEDWKNFVRVINKGKEAYLNSKHKIEDHFSDVGKMVTLGSSGQRQIEDIKLTRYA